jgi:hypothetical protein
MGWQAIGSGAAAVKGGRRLIITSGRLLLRLGDNWLVLSQYFPLEAPWVLISRNTTLPQMAFPCT